LPDTKRRRSSSVRRWVKIDHILPSRLHTII
jgi:hypothetical protein